MIDQLLNQFASPTRREFLKTSGRLVVGFTAASHLVPFALSAQGAAGRYPDPDWKKLDSWLVIHQDNTATFYVGKTDLGQGTGTSFRQMMSSELDFPFARTTCIMGNTDITVDQGGSGGSDAIQTDGWPMRRVAAEARRVLLDMGSQHFGVPVDQLAVSEGVISVKADAGKQVTYGDLIGGKRFNVALTGGDINATTGQAKVKPVQELKYVGQSPARDDIPSKVDASPVWAVDVKVPGMLHARNVKPPVAGATCVSVDESSVAGMPGLVKVVRERNYVAVVCEREEQAIAAAKRLKVSWQKPATAPFPASPDLFTYMRGAKAMSSPAPTVKGSIEDGLAGAAMRVEAEYEVPFQGHTSIGPAHGMADPSNGQMTIYSNDMKSYGLRNGVAEFLKIPRENVRVVWMQGPQGYGRTAADDAGFEAAYLAQQLGRPVRMQWMRDEETAWDTKGPAYVMKMRGGLDARGNLVALDYEALAADYCHLGYNESDTVLIAQLTGRRRATPASGGASSPDDMYKVSNRRAAMHIVSLPLVWETPLRTGNLRDPNGPQTTFGGESFIDELAAAAKADPVEFRMRLLTAGKGDDSGFKRARSIAVIKAAAEKFGWDARPSPKTLSTGNILTGRGMAYAFRNQTVVATFVEVEVNRRTGRVWAKRIVVGHDCGLVINPQSLTHAIEGAAMHGLSRALYEEVTFDTEKVTTVDWRTSPTLRHADAPEKIDVVLVNGDPNPNRPDLNHYGAGEAALKPMIAAVANAIYDATGARIRRVPLRPERAYCVAQDCEGITMPFYERGPVRIRYEETGSGFPLLVIPGGGLNSTVAGLRTLPFNPMEEFKGEYRVIAADLRNAAGGESTGPLEADRPWDAFTDDQLGVLDHLGIDRFMVMGFCIGGPMVWSVLKRAPNRVVAGVLAQPSGWRPEMPTLNYDTNMAGWGPELVKRRPEITMPMVDAFLTKMYRANADFVFTVTRDFVRNCKTPVLIMPDDIPAHPYATAMEAAMLAPNAEVSMFPWKEPKERVPLAVRQIHSFLKAHRPAGA